jgi:hypothetical protein
MRVPCAAGLQFFFVLIRNIAAGNSSDAQKNQYLYYAQQITFSG